MKQFPLEVRSPNRRSFPWDWRLALALVLSAAIHEAHAIDGQVLDEATNQPIADAIVVVRWQATLPRLVDTATACFHVESARTDTQGRYHIEDWRGFWAPQNWLLSDRQVHFDAYKAGYVGSDKDRPKPEILYLAAFKGTVEERFAYLLRFISGCGFGDQSQKNFYRLYWAIYEEAHGLAETPVQKRRVGDFADWAESVLVNRVRPTTRNQRGVEVNVDPNDSFKKEDLLK